MTNKREEQQYHTALGNLSCALEIIAGHSYAPQDFERVKQCIGYLNALQESIAEQLEQSQPDGYSDENR